MLGTKRFIRDTVEPYMKHTGAALSPFNAWVLLKGLETLTLRVRAQAAAAAQLAEAVSAHPAVIRTIYPGRADHPQHELVKQQMTGHGTVLSFEVKGGQAGAFLFMNALSNGRHRDRAFGPSGPVRLRCRSDPGATGTVCRR